MTDNQCIAVAMLLIGVICYISGYRARGEDPYIYEYDLLVTRIKQLKKQLADKNRDKKGRYA